MIFNQSFMMLYIDISFSSYNSRLHLTADLRFKFAEAISIFNLYFLGTDVLDVVKGIVQLAFLQQILFNDFFSLFHHCEIVFFFLAKLCCLYMMVGKRLISKFIIVILDSHNLNVFSTANIFLLLLENKKVLLLVGEF